MESENVDISLSMKTLYCGSDGESSATLSIRQTSIVSLILYKVGLCSVYFRVAICVISAVTQMHWDTFTAPFYGRSARLRAREHVMN